MATEISFDGAPTTGVFRSYAEDGFSFTTKLGATPVFSDVLWSGLHTERCDQQSREHVHCDQLNVSSGACAAAASKSK